MRKRAIATPTLILIGTLALSACGGSAMPTPSSQITLATNPNPPVMGMVELIIDVKDAQGQPLDGADVLVLISHTSMSGMDQRGRVTARGNGRYVTVAEFAGMSGEWLITVQVRKDDLNLAQDFRVEVK